MKSKVDRITEVFERRLEKAIDSVMLEMHREGKGTYADALNYNRNRIRLRMTAAGTYERLELDDIIKGHKRAWPE